MILNAIKQIEIMAKSNSDVISLGQGIPFQGSDDVIRRAAVQAIMLGLADKYSEPAGLYELRTKISEMLQADGMAYDPGEIIVTSGAMEALSVSLMSLVTEEKNEVIVPTPVYAAYFKAIELAGGRAVEVPLDEGQSWSLNLEALKEKITDRTAAILICNPNNPTGSVYPKNILMELAEVACRHDFTLVVDEVYGNIVFDGGPIYTPAKEAEFRENIIRIVSFSKDFSLTGWRIGFLQADQSKICRLLAVHDTLVNCASVVAQYAAIAAIDNHDRITRSNREVYLKNRQIMCEYLDELNDYLTYEIPPAAYFVFPKLKNVNDSTKFALELLQKEGLAVVPGDAFGSGGERHIRICFGRSGADIRGGMERLSSFLTAK